MVVVWSLSCVQLLWPHGLYSLSVSSVHGNLQARILKWVAISFSRGSSRPRDRTLISCIAGRRLKTVFPYFLLGQGYMTLLTFPNDWSSLMWPSSLFCLAAGEVLVAQACLTLFDPMACSPWSSSVHGIFQARILEWIAIPFSRGFSLPRDWTRVSCIAGRFFTILVTREAPGENDSKLPAGEILFNV